MEIELCRSTLEELQYIRIKKLSSFFMFLNGNARSDEIATQYGH